MLANNGQLSIIDMNIVIYSTGTLKKSFSWHLKQYITDQGKIQMFDNVTFTFKLFQLYLANLSPSYLR